MNITSLDMDLGSAQNSLAQATGAVIGVEIVLAVISYFIGKACRKKNKKTGEEQEENAMLLK